MAAILTVTLPLFNYCAPVQEDISFLDEDPTLDPLPVPSYPKNTSRNEFIRNLNRCLKLRDESRDLRAQGCIPDVFSTDSDVPLAAHSNTVLSFLSVNCKSNYSTYQITTIHHLFFFPLYIASVVDNQLHFIINNLQDLSAGIIHTNAVHLRIYKSDISDDKLLSTMLREGGLKLSLTVSNDSLLAPMVTNTAQFLQELTISRADLINEGWLDFNLDKVKFLHVYSKFTNAHKLHLQVTIVPDSGSISVFKDIGINNILVGDEPVLIIYGKENLQFITQKFLPTTLQRSIKAKRDIILPEGGSGVLTDSEVCRLIEYQVRAIGTYNPLLLTLLYSSYRCLSVNLG